MRLLRVGQPGRERPAALLEDGSLVDLSPVTGELDGAFLAGGGLERASDALDRGNLPALDAGGRVGAQNQGSHGFQKTHFPMAASTGCSSSMLAQWRRWHLAQALKCLPSSPSSPSSPTSILL